MQVHTPYLVGPGVYSFGVALKAVGGDLSLQEAVASGSALRARWLRDAT